MKTVLSLLFFLSLCVCTFAAQFQNLGFDGANTNNAVPANPERDVFGPAAEILPGWQLFRGGEAQADIGLNLSPIGGGVASLYGLQNRLGLPVSGSYSFAMYPSS